MIATLILFGAGTTLPRLAVTAGVGVGGRQRAAVRWCSCRSCCGSRPTCGWRSIPRRSHVRTIGRNFLPAVVSRGVNQLSAYIDQVIASWLSTGAVTGLQNASTLYTLPVSLFGMSVSAAELPAMSGIAGADPAAIEAVRRAARRRPAPHRLLRRPVGGRVSRARRRGRRRAVSDRPVQPQRLDLRLADSRRLDGRTAGVDARRGCIRPPTTRFATRARRCATPSIRVALTTVLGYLLRDPAAAAARAGAGVGRGGADRVGRHRRLGGDAAAARDAERADRPHRAAGAVRRAALGIRDCRRRHRVGREDRLPSLHPILTAVLVLGPYGLVFLAMTLVLRIPEASTSLARVMKR